jgi:hypothetical protein
MGLLDRTPLTMLRKEVSEGYLKDGKFIEDSTEEEVLIRGSLQPLGSGREKLRLEESIRARATYKLYTKAKLKVSDDILQTTSDETIIKGLRYEIYADADWTHYGLSSDHYRYILLRKDKI